MAGQKTNKISKNYSSVLNSFLKGTGFGWTSSCGEGFDNQYMNQARLTANQLISMEYEYTPTLPNIMAKLTNAPGAEYSVLNNSYEKYQRLLTERDRLRSLLDSFLKKYDALLVPVTMTAAYPLPEIKFDMGMADVTTNIKIDGKNYFQYCGRCGKR